MLKLRVGWIVGFLMTISMLANISHTQIHAISSLFMGFILLAILIVIREERKNMGLSATSMIALLVGIAVVALITYFNPVAGSGSSVNLARLDIGLIVYVFTSAMFTISAVVLPGINGSTLLLISGLYIPTTPAIEALMGFDFSYIPILFVLGSGIITDVTTVVHLVEFAPDKHRSIMIFLITGMMLGSFYAVVMGPQTLETPQTPFSLETLEILWFIIGGAIIFGFQKMKDISEK